MDQTEYIVIKINFSEMTNLVNDTDINNILARISTDTVSSMLQFFLLDFSLIMITTRSH